MSKTAITVTWPAVPGATKYAVARNGKPVTSTVQPSVHGLQVVNGDTVTVTPTVPAPIPVPTPPPPPASGLVDDMRASRMTSLTGQMVAIPGAIDTVVDHNGVPLGSGWTTRRSQAPVIWDELQFVDDDITLIVDPAHGPMYRYRLTGNSHNPSWSTPTVGSAELVKYRTLSLGQWDWYGLGVLWEPGWDWTLIDWSVVLQCGYPTISTPPLGIYAGYGDNVYVQRWAGPVIAGPAQADIWNVRKQSVVAGHLLEMVLGVKWGSNKDGEIHYLDRCKTLGETAFTERVTAAGITTWQWGTAGGVSAPQNPVNLRVDDKQSLYRGYLPPVTDATVPTNYVRHTGYVRCADKATVLACMEGTA